MSTGATPAVAGPALDPLTASQRDVVCSTAQRLLVGAGAGSGKTSTVVRMVCYLLGATVHDHDGNTLTAPQTLELGEIAAITFTNQAAADLKRKLRQALKLSNMPRIAAEVDGARIGTIHGFCGDLLREFALRAGLRPNVTVIDELQSLAIESACAEQALTEAVESRDPSWLEPLVSGRRIRDVAQFIQVVARDTARLDAYAANRDQLRPHEERLLDLAIRAVELRRAQMKDDGLYDFDSLLVVTRDLLRDHADVRRAIQRRIRVLIVDEFQDVDPVQRDIAMLLGGLDTDDADPSRIVLVGDPKQSIFRFRRADVTIWNDVSARFGTASAVGATAELSDNFRSRKGILALVDRVIGVALDRAVSPDGERQPFEVAYTPLTARGKHAAGDECVELRCVPASPDGKPRKAGEVRVLEAQDVASRIAALRGDGYGYGDMAILLAGWGEVDLYEAALRARGIPVYVLRGEGFWEAREIIDCLLALRAIRDGRDAVVDQVALIGFLKSPFVGVRDETLLALAQQGAGLREALRTEPRERVLLDRACAILERFGALRDRMPLGALLQRLCMETGFLAALSVDPARGAQAMGNVRKLIRLASESGDLSLGEWLREVEEVRAAGVKEAQERLYRERADVVTITSIHSAKGLEWPVVFWCDTVRGGRPESGTLLDGRELFRVKDVSHVDEEGDDTDDVFAEFAMQQSLERQAEAYRLWYVAATRPQQLLVLSGIALSDAKSVSASRDEGDAEGTATVRKFTGSPGDLIREAFASELAAPTVPAVISYAHADGTMFRMTVAMVATDIAARDVRTDVRATDVEPAAFLAPARVRAHSGRRRLSATQLMQFVREPTAWESRYVRSLDPEERRLARAAGTEDSARSGTIVHQVLERWNANDAELDQLIDAAITQHATVRDDEGQRAALRRSVREIVRKVTSHDRWNGMTSNATARRELTFTRILPDGSTIEGAFDLVAVIDGRTVILDVKSGAQRDATTLADRYAVQGATYRAVAEALVPDRPATFELLQAADGALISVEQGVELIMDTIERLRRHDA
ncbi:MAG: ATP-dependent DNA helicase [Gemmatimonadaceae bacterium]|nr:ATP-dependent DNA helicase [Gemmatimonadaceae bacterium]